MQHFQSTHWEADFNTVTSYRSHLCFHHAVSQSVRVKDDQIHDQTHLSATDRCKNDQSFSVLVNLIGWSEEKLSWFDRFDWIANQLDSNIGGSYVWSIHTALGSIAIDVRWRSEDPIAWLIRLSDYQLNRILMVAIDTLNDQFLFQSIFSWQSIHLIWHTQGCGFW